MSLGYRLPGTIIEEVTVPKSVNISSSQRKPCFIGKASAYKKVTHESVVRGNTGLSDRLAYTSAGIYEIIEVGSQRGLNNFIEGTHFNLSNDEIVWTSTGWLVAGATYFVTYQYVRPDEDYKYKEFYNYEDVVDDLGDDIPDNPLVMISKLALKYYNVPAIGIVQVPSAGTTSDYGNALDLIKYRDVQTVCCLTTSAAVRALLISHVQERSLPDNGRYRIGWTGAAAGTVIGDESDPTSLRGMAVAIRKERIVFPQATRAQYSYNDPTTKQELTTTVDGSFIAAAIAAYRDSYAHPTTTLLNKTIPGLTLFADDYDDYYSEYMLTLAGSSSLLLVTPSAAGGMTVIDDLTTDNSTVERNNINIITAKDYVAKDVAIQMDRTFKGSLIKSRPGYQQVVSNYLKILFQTYLTNNVIESIGTLRVSLPPERRDTVSIFYSYYAVYTHKYTEGQYALEI